MYYITSITGPGRDRSGCAFWVKDKNHLEEALREYQQLGLEPTVERWDGAFWFRVNLVSGGETRVFYTLHETHLRLKQARRYDF